MNPQILDDYLETLHASLVWGNCAGKRARVSNLNQNRLICDDDIVDKINSLLRLVTKKTYKKEQDFFNEFDGKFYRRKGKRIFEEAEKYVTGIETNALFEKWKGRFGGKGQYPDKINVFKDLRNHIEEAMDKSEELRNQITNSWDLEDPYAENTELRPDVELGTFILNTSEGYSTYENEVSVHTNYNIHMTLGQPGFGKTIHLQQFAESEVRRLRAAKGVYQIPLFIKATHLAQANEKIATRKVGILENSIRREYKIPQDGEERFHIIDHAMTLRDPMFEGFIHKLQNLDMSTEYLLIVDALDECKEDDLLAVTAFITQFCRGRVGQVVVSCRYSHRSAFETNCERLLDGYSKLYAHHLDFTPNELRHEMPIKLANAWGIRGNRLGIIIDRDFEKYQSVLTHPLFVGFFARLVIEEWNELPDTLSHVQKSARFLGKYNFLHISFLMNVINRGIELAIKERHANKNIDTDRIKELFEAFSFVSLSENTKDIDTIVNTIKLVTDLSPTETEIAVLKEGVGLLYSTDQIHAEWVHKTIAEVGCGKFLFKKPQYGTRSLLEVHQCTALAFLFQNIKESNSPTMGDVLHNMLQNRYMKRLPHMLMWLFEEYYAPLFERIEIRPEQNPPYVFILSHHFEQNDVACFIHQQANQMGYTNQRHFVDCIDDAIRYHKLIGLNKLGLIELIRSDLKSEKSIERFASLSTLYQDNFKILSELSSLAMIMEKPFIENWLERHTSSTSILYFALVEACFKQELLYRKTEIMNDFWDIKNHTLWLSWIFKEHEDFIKTHHWHLDTLGVTSIWLDNMIPKEVDLNIQRLMILNSAVRSLWHFGDPMSSMNVEISDRMNGKLKIAIQKIIVPSMRGDMK